MTPRLQELLANEAEAERRYAVTTASLHARQETFLESCHRLIDERLGLNLNAPCCGCGSVHVTPDGKVIHVASCPEMLISLQSNGVRQQCTSCRSALKIPSGEILHLSGCLDLGFGAVR